MTAHTGIFISPVVCMESAQMACVHGRGSPGVGAGQHLFALVHIVASDVAQDEDDPEEGYSTQHLHGYPQLAGAQLLGDPRMRTASEPNTGRFLS